MERKGEFALETKRPSGQSSLKIFASFWRHAERAPTARFHSSLGQQPRIRFIKTRQGLKARITRIEIAMTADEPRRWRCFERPQVSWGVAPRWDCAGPLALKSKGGFCKESRTDLSLTCPLLATRRESANGAVPSQPWPTAKEQGLSKTTQG
jgi:hypothetical protein